MGAGTELLPELLAGLRVVALPMRERFRGLTVRETALLHGPAGWSEFAAFTEYPDAEAAHWLAAAVEWAWTAQPAPPLRDAVPVNATVPSVSPAEVPAVLARFPGCTTAKVKVAQPGQTLEDDVARVAAVRSAMGPAARIRVDANGAWSVPEAERATLALRPYGLDYIEQPCASVPELAALRRRLAGSGLRIAADESVRRAEDPLAVARAGAADVLVVKAAPLGGVRRALAIVAEAGLPATVSSALESSVGLAAGVALAAALPAGADGTIPAAGLGTAALFAADIVSPALLPREGALPARRTEPDPALLERWAAAPERTAWWRARIERCAELLA